MLTQLNNLFRSKKIGPKLIRSHFMIALIGVLMMAISISLFYWLRHSTQNLIEVNIPLVRAIENLETAVQKSLADLRAWIVLHKNEFKVSRRHVWLNEIFPLLQELKKMEVSGSSAINYKLNLQQLTNKLADLNVWQWRIEDIAGTPSNTPLLRFFDSKISPILRRVRQNTEALLALDRQATTKTHISLVAFREHLTRSFDFYRKHSRYGNQIDFHTGQQQWALAEKSLLDNKRIKDTLNSEQLEIYDELTIDMALLSNLKKELLNKKFNRVHNISFDWLANKAIPTVQDAQKFLSNIDHIVLSNSNKNMQQVHNISQIIPILLILLTILVIFVSYWLALHNAAHLSKPILLLVEATKKMAEGKLNKNIAVTSKDELGNLTKNFNKMREQRQIAEQKINAMMAKLDDLARKDNLTKLANRYHLQDIVKKLCDLSKRKNRQFAFLLLDLDHFKQINDTYGHDIGDELLKEVAKRLENITRSSDLISRLGGDEIAVVLTEITSGRDAGIYAENVLRALRKPYQLGDYKIQSTPSIGIALFPESGTDATTLYKNADVALYHSKESGRNTFAYYSPSMDANKEKINQLRDELSNAKENNELSLIYYPVVDLKSGQILSTEVILIWESKSFGQMKQIEFEHVADQIGIMHEFDKETINMACVDIKCLHDSFLSVPVSVRISLSSLKDREKIDNLIEIFYKNNIDLSQVFLEVSGAVLEIDHPKVEENLQTLHKKGVGIILDNFGDHKFSLPKLRYLPINKLKISPKYLNGLLKSDPENIQVLIAIIKLTEILNIDAIALGIVNKSQVKFLLSNGCNKGQGHYFSKPLPIDSLKLFLDNKAK